MKGGQPIAIYHCSIKIISRGKGKSAVVAAGMCADVCIHDTGGGNPHAHIMLTMHPFEQGGEWGAKQKKEYILDPQGNKIYDPKKRQYKCNSIPATDWNEHTKAEEWRVAWADCVNVALEQNGHTERGNLNREIEISNQNLRQLKARIGKLQNWLKEEQQSTAPTKSFLQRQQIT